MLYITTLTHTITQDRYAIITRAKTKTLAHKKAIRKFSRKHNLYIKRWDKTLVCPYLIITSEYIGV